MVYGEPYADNFVKRNLRALLLLSATIAPSVITANLIVFGKQMRDRMIAGSGMPILIRGLWYAVYVAAALIMAIIVLALIYRVGRPRNATWESVIPGAVVAALLWWPVSSAFGLYLRHIPYRMIYGGLAVAIGLMLWMQLSASIILIGAAYNAEVAASQSVTRGAMESLPRSATELQSAPRA